MRLCCRERWPSGRRHQIANSVHAVLPDQVTPWNPCKSRVLSRLTSYQITSREIMLDTFGHFALETLSQICEIC
jgi:hypothetical protein